MTTTTQIDFYASAVQYVDHLAPIWAKIRPDHRGAFLAGAGPAADIARLDYGIDTKPLRKRGKTRMVVVASFGDLRSVGAEDIVFVEHGAGQTYSSDHPSGPGGRNRDGIRLYITPNYEVAAANTAAYPDVPNVIAGVPKLDPWVMRDISRNDPPVVAVSFTWDRPQAAEAKSAYDHYRRYLHRVARAFPGALAHGHPRVFPSRAGDFIRFGFEPVGRFNEILDRADIYVADNSSTLYEFAATGRPVVVLNAPWYRRHVEHGLRFWRHADVGLQVDDPATLVDTITLALTDPPNVATRRQSVIDEVYPRNDGHAAERAADAIMALFTSDTIRGRRCAVCGDPHATCATTLEDGTPVETLADLEATMQSTPANYRVDRLINGRTATIAVTEAELTDNERKAFGLKAARPAPNKSRPASPNKAPGPAEEPAAPETPAEDPAEDPEDTPEAPPKSANKSEWEAYATALGLTTVDAGGHPLTKDAIIALTGA